MWATVDADVHGDINVLSLWFVKTSATGCDGMELIPLSVNTVVLGAFDKF